MGENMKHLFLAISFLFLLLVVSCGGSGTDVSNPAVRESKIGDATITNGELTISTCNKFAGSVCSIKYNNNEYIDIYRHGRQIQSAVNYKTNKGPESYNPTEAGNSRDSDRVDNKSTSRIIDFNVEPDSIYLINQMAYWLEPNQCTPNNVSCAVNTIELSDTFLTKEIRLSYRGVKNAVLFKSMFELESIVEAGVLDSVQFQSTVTHHPSSWDLFYTYDNGLKPFEPNENNSHRSFKYPIIVSSRDKLKSVAMIKIREPLGYTSVYTFKYSPESGSSFSGESGVSVLFDVYRTTLTLGSTHTFETVLIFGSLDDVVNSIKIIKDFD